MSKILVLALALLATGCSNMNSTSVLTSDHPASLDAPASSIPAASTALNSSDPVLPAASGTPDGGGSHQHRPDGMTGMTPASKDPPATTQSDVSGATFVCPMHPEVTSDKPGKCPKCGMALVKKRQENERGAGHDGH